MIDFTIGIEPHGKGRPRATTVGKTARVFTPKKTRDWEKAFRTLSNQYMPELLTGPLVVTVHASFHRPKRMSTRSTRTGELLGGYTEGEQWMTSRPDADNVAKSVLDALSDWYKDDSQVVDLRVTKVYHAMGGKPSVRVTIRGAGEELVAQTRGRG